MSRRARGVTTAGGPIRGGFQASMLPRSSDSSTSTQTSSGSGSQTIIIGGSSPLVNNQGKQLEANTSIDLDSGHHQALVLKGLRGLEQRLLCLEKKQDKNADTLRDIHELVRKFKESFSIKGSPFEVCTNMELFQQNYL